MCIRDSHRDEDTEVPMAAQHHPSPLIAGEGLQFRQQGGGEQDRVARLTLPAGRRCEDPRSGGVQQPGRRPAPQAGLVGCREQEKILRRNGAQGGEPRPDGEGQAPGAVRAVHRPGPRRLGGLKNRAIAGHDGQITVLPGPDQAGQSVQPVAEQGLSLQWTQQLVAPEAAAAARRQIDDVLIHPGPAGPSPG